ncbi:MAG TPA: hypothetical protein VFO96_06000 [Gemmatimonadales bacterium]|nr:hypothetical protein [Gemmatimonadales bacterium]
MRRHHRQAWRVVAQACIIALLIGCDSTEPAAPEVPEQPATGLRLEARSDTTLTGTVGSRIASVPVVRLTTLDGDPAPGREIRFSASGGGSIEIASQRTDTAGLASPGRWTLGIKAQPQTLTARVVGAADLVFRVTAKAGSPDTAQIVAGNHQTAAAGAPLPKPLQVKLADRYGNPVPDASVTYAVITGGGTLRGANATTDSLGLATSGTWTLGSAGAQLVTMSVAGKEMLFDAFACDDRCRGRDLLFASGSALYSIVNDVSTRLFTTEASAGAVEVWVSSAEWSPDGQKIAFTVIHYDWADDESHVALYLMDADGSNAILRADGFSDPSWSPDGRWVAVTGPDGIYTVSAEADGTAPVLLAEGASDPAWSPDGTKVAFAEVVSDPELGVHGSLKVMHADGTAVTTIVNDGAGVVGDPAWSPDGERLAFIKCGESSCSSLFTVSAGGGDPVEVSPGMGASDPAWSPDGSRIAFGTQDGIAWLPADGSFSQPILLIAYGRSPAWRP